MQPERRSRFLAAMGITEWVRRGQAPLPDATSANDIAVPVEGPERQHVVDTLEWNELTDAIKACRACALSQTRTQAVPGVGNSNADWMIIGEAPGAEEDRKGEPFVGRAGRLLDEILRAAGFARNDVFIANILKCRPPNNRDPRVEEVTLCTPFLERQIELIRPRIILALGRVAAQRLLGSDAPLARLRGRIHHYGPARIPLVVTYHPAYLLRSPREKRKVWDDLCFALDTVAETA